MTTHTLIQMKVNGTVEALAVETLSQLLDAKGVDTGRKGIAVAVNGAVVPRVRWPAHGLASGDSVEIIQARQGG